MSLFKETRKPRAKLITDKENPEVLKCLKKIGECNETNGLLDMMLLNAHYAVLLAFSMTTEHLKMNKYSCLHICLVSETEGVVTVDASKQSMGTENTGPPSKNIAKVGKVHIEKDFIGFHSSTPRKFSCFL